MDRKDFLKKVAVAGVVAAATPQVVKASGIKLKKFNYDEMLAQVGFNHLPNTELKTMNSIVHKSNSRGHANHGWLDSYHSFSFANYYNPERMNFGVLRVLNDDRIAGGKGFGTHPHDNMEIISIPISGALEHKDSMGNVAVINEGEIQVMSAGTGIFHSEYNKHADQQAEFLQIWVFPNKKNVTPRYDQISIADVKTDNKLYQILSPSKDDQGVWIHQDAWFHLGDFSKGATDTYELRKPGNGIYFFVIEGEIQVGDQKLEQRDGYGLWDTQKVEILANRNAKVLVMEVPMSL